MTLAVHQPQQRQWVRRSEVVTPSGVRATVRPLGAAGVGLLSALVGAWGGICVFVGPYFGYRPTSATTWEWTTNNWLLHLVPGAVAVFAGLMILTLSPMRRAGSGVRSGLGLMGLLLAASGTWFVIGPAMWPTFQSSPAYATGTGAWTSFWNQLGANLGPGLLLAFFGGMAVKAGTARPAVAIGEPDETAAPAGRDPVLAPSETNRSAEAYDETSTSQRDAGPQVETSRQAETSPQAETRPADMPSSRSNETAAPDRSGQTTAEPAVNQDRRHGEAETGGPGPDVTR